VRHLKDPKCNWLRAFIVLSGDDVDFHQQLLAFLRSRTLPLACVILSILLIITATSGGLQALGIPPGSDIALVILIIAAIFWVTEIIPLFATSFLVLLLCLVWLLPGLTVENATVTKTTFLSPFFSDVILLFLGGFTLSAALHKYGLDERLARWMLSKTGDSIPRLLAGVMLITAVLSMWLSNTATAAMMLTLVLPIAQQIPDRRRSVRQAIVLAIPIAANVGGIGTPIGTPPNAIALQYLQKIGSAPTFTTWMIIGVPMMLLMLVCGWFVLITLFKARGTLESSEEKPEPLPPLKLLSPTTLVIVIAGVTILGWVTSQWHGLSSGTVALFPVIGYFATQLLSSRDLKALSWDVLFLMGGGLCLGAAIATSGLADWVVSLLPVEGATIYAIMVIFALVGCCMSSVMSNTATANLMMPIILGLTLSEPLTPILLGVAFSCSMAMPLPISTPPNAMAFSSGELSVKDMVRPGLLLTIAGLILTFTLGYFWWKLVGVI